MRAMFSSSHIAMRFFKERPVTSKRFFDVGFVQRHCHTLMLRISLGFTWLLTLVARLHGMADFDSRHIASTPPVNQKIFFLSRFFIQNTLLEWLQEHLRLNEEDTCNIALWLYEKQITTWSFVLTGYKVLSTSVSTSVRILQLWCQQGETQTWPSMCMWRKLIGTLAHPIPPTQDVT